MRCLSRPGPSSRSAGRPCSARPPTATERCGSWRRPARSRPQLFGQHAETPGTARQARQETADGQGPDGENIEEIDSTTRLVLYGRILPASDRRLLAAFGVHLAAQLERQQLVASRREMMRLAESNTMRTSILRAVSHDLRTPLAGIKLAVGGLRQPGARYTPQEEQELLATIEECSDRLDLLVGNLLDMSRITSDSASPQLRPLRWYEVIPGALHGVPPGQVRVELPANMPEIDADQGMLERVVANIVENAVKYAPDSDIVVAGTAGGLSPATLAGRPAGELRIIDHGRGVPAERVLDMFRPFQRLDDATQAAGVGLGLAVAKGFTEAMGGRLAAEPTPGGGLTMVITLPLSSGEPVRRAHGPVPAGAAIAADQTTPRPPAGAADIAVPVALDCQAGGAMTAVLVVDDDPHLLRALRITLQAHGYDVSAAADGRSALLKARQEPPSVVILDLGLPDLDGTAVIRQLRGYSRVPILVLSARHGSEDKVQALDAGADDYITKPFGLDELLARLRALLRRTIEPEHEAVVSTENFTVDLGKRRVVRDGQDVRLTPTEWNMLEVLVRNPEKLITQQQLLSEVWGPAYAKETNYLRVYMAQLRRKLEPDTANPRHLLTEAGIGYRFMP